MKKILLLFCTTALLLHACNTNDDNTGTDDTSVVNTVLSTIVFTQSWDGENITNADFQKTNFTNENGEVLQIGRMRYLISNIQLVAGDGTVYNLSEYHLVNMSDGTTLAINPGTELPVGNYTLNFIYGFTEADNRDNAYPDLNLALWNWPEMLGGGYHFMQFDGTYNVNTNDPKPFNYHNGTARVSDGVFEQNFVAFSLPNLQMEANENTLQINMNVAEWFKNPYTWDLNVYGTSLMPNYKAQKLMNGNAETVFTVTINNSGEDPNP
ncbi:MAG: MbnP family protein [Marinirhabdus sp.]